MADTDISHTLLVDNCPYTWQVDRGTMATAGVRGIVLWLDPSLRLLFEPMAQEMGVPLFRLLVAYHASLSADTDYEACVSHFGPTFQEGFLAWGRAVSASGWGVFEMPHYDLANKRATVRVRNAWELGVQARSPEPWGCPIIAGKIIGLFTIAFGTNCWADETIITTGDAPCVELEVYASDRTIAEELSRLRQERLEEAQRPLAEKLAIIEEQQEAIRVLGSPILEVWDGVLALPIIGRVDARRAAEITGDLLERIVATQSQYAILDLTGVDTVDAATAEHFGNIIRAVSLLGAECLVCGIRPAVAQAMATHGMGTERATTYGTMRSALMAVIGKRR
ncbi:STAS domain-containing protein [Polyangium aurulentum]|uniref:STAS domain-containing protein n=1 Tax=Polyangium aurulentum TaxID=2567896 RepID=UPI0010AE272C|nr:STAS domain-containing protein [Polyangium aurulentum]UQA55793.1 STAS domain-containing protein [Polyangium aurulentum]